MDDPDTQAIPGDYLKIIEKNGIIPVSKDENELIRRTLKNQDCCLFHEFKESAISFLTRAEAYKPCSYYFTMI